MDKNVDFIISNHSNNPLDYETKHFELKYEVEMFSTGQLNGSKKKN